jgi:hypothetical protein
VKKWEFSEPIAVLLVGRLTEEVMFRPLELFYLASFMAIILSFSITISLWGGQIPFLPMRNLLIDCYCYRDILSQETACSA